MPDRSQPDFESLFFESLDPRAVREKCGIPHPLSNFAVSGGRALENAYSDSILGYVNDLSLEDPETMPYQSAHWFLMESTKAFFLACDRAGIDGAKLRDHLRRAESGEITDID